MSDLCITREEYLARRDRVADAIEREGIPAMVLFNSTSIAYLTAFTFIPTERPAALVLERGRASLYLPRLDQEHAEETAVADLVQTYPEYPGEYHPMRGLADFLRELGLASGVLGADAPGYGSGMGYEGPRLEEVLPSVSFHLFPKLVEKLRMVKSPQEIRLIRESARWGNLAHALLQEYSRPGLSENEIAMRASLEATQAMIRTLGPGFEPRGGEGAFAGFRGQIGPNSALPHAITRNLRLRPGDVLVTGAGAAVWGYHSELERTMFVGRPDPQQRRYFDLMVELQDLALASIRPGLPCSEVDRAMRSSFDGHGLWPHWRHHVGHALGMLGHEAPFLDIGDQTIIEPGMVFSVEPGLYVPGLGGFRHSDTLVVTDDGIDLLTYYPRDIESLICG